jgi:hypothetical protein
MKTKPSSMVRDCTADVLWTRKGTEALRRPKGIIFLVEAAIAAEPDVLPFSFRIFLVAEIVTIGQVDEAGHT